MKGTSIANWFRIRAKIPGVVASVLVLCLIGTLLVIHLNDQIKQRDAVLNQILKSLSVGVVQKNLILIESVLESSRIQLPSSGSAICKGEIDLISSLKEKNICNTGKNSFFIQIIERPIASFKDLRFVAKVERFPHFLWQLSLFLSVIFASGFYFLLLFRLESRIQSELIHPLRSGVFSDEHLKIIELENIRNIVMLSSKAKEQVAVAEAIQQMNAQVAHDIKSPLAALKMIESDLDALPKDLRLVTRFALQRIGEIANSLGKNSTSSFSTSVNATNLLITRPILASLVLDSIISEKKLEFRNRDGLEIGFVKCKNSDFLYINIDENEFKRAISNLINNSIEAIPMSGRVLLVLKETIVFDERLVIIKIKDSGAGIPTEFLNRLGERGFTAGKMDFKDGTGTGLGIWHAKSTIEGFGGRIDFKSRHCSIDPNNSGTTVTIKIPGCDPFNLS